MVTLTLPLAWVDAAPAERKTDAPTARKTRKDRQRTRKKNPALEKIQDDPKLPRVLLIGDSISIGYTLPARGLLKNKANLHRILANGGPTTRGVANLSKWLGNGKWDAIHFNFGLHDLKYMPETQGLQVSLRDYEKNLKTIVAKLRQTGAVVIWASTTPVQDDRTPPNRKRLNKDVEAYNAIAKKIMTAEKIAINDLHAVAKGAPLAEIQTKDGVHFTKEGSKRLAKCVAAAITEALNKR
jgi:acyl-CoA thioesterase-1